MSLNEWKINWVKTVIDGGFSQRTALDTYHAMYGCDGPDLSKSAEVEALLMLGRIETH